VGVFHGCLLSHDGYIAARVPSKPYDAQQSCGNSLPALHIAQDLARSGDIDRDIPFLERQRAAMARTAGRLDFSRSTGWITQALAICIGPMLVLFSEEVGPVPAPSASLTVQRPSHTTGSASPPT
jgi:hypothetical protein